jgi:alpha-glucosidase/alpha-D-xyloside xylohydrolase
MSASENLKSVMMQGQAAGVIRPIRQVIHALGPVDSAAKVSLQKSQVSIIAGSEQFAVMTDIGETVDVSVRGTFSESAKLNEMSRAVSRREALARLSAAGASTVLAAHSTAFGTSPPPDSPLIVAGRPIEVWISVLNKRTARISLLPLREDGRVPTIEDDIVPVQKRWSAPVAKLRSGPASQMISWGEKRISVSADPITFVVESAGKKILQRIEVRPENGAVRFLLGGGPVFGLGEGGPQFDRRGSVYSTVHGQGVPGLGIFGARMPIPWLIGTEGWGLFFHLPQAKFDLTNEDGIFEPEGSASPFPLDLFIVIAEDPAQVLEDYARLTGFPHMPPLWALGYQQSHRTLASRDEVMSEAETFRQKRLPCDVLIYLGTGFRPSGWNLAHGSYRFNPRAFPDPAEIIDELHHEHFRVVLHEHQPPQQLHGSVTD